MRLKKAHFKISILITLLATCIIIIFIESNDLISSTELTRIEPNYIVESKLSSLRHKCKIAIITKWKNESYIQWLVKSLQTDKRFMSECKLKAYSLDHLNSTQAITNLNEDQLEQLKDFKHILLNFKPNELMLKLATIIQDISTRIKIFYLLDFDLAFKNIHSIRSIEEFNTSYFIVTNRSNYLTLKYSYGIHTDKLILIEAFNLIKFKSLLANFQYKFKNILSNESVISQESVYLNDSNLRSFITNNLHQYYCLYSDTSVQINIQVDSTISLVSVGIITKSKYLYAHSYSGIYSFDYFSNSSNTIDSTRAHLFETISLGLKLTLVKNSLTLQFLKLHPKVFSVGILTKAFKELNSKNWNQISLKLSLSDFNKYKLKVNDIFSTKCDIFTFIKPIKKKQNNLVNFVIEGPVFSYNSFAVVNRKLFLALYELSNLNVLIKPEEFELSENDFEMLLVYHLYKQQEVNLSSKLVLFRNSGTFVERINWNKIYNNISQIKLVHHQPWEFHAVPIDWIRYFHEICDEIWVPSSYNRLAYITNGIKPIKIHVIPHGIFMNEFNSVKTNQFAVLSSKKFKFLTIGGMVARKGIDLILESYSSLFTNKDDVSLIIHCIYGYNYALEKLKSIQNRNDSPEIIYMKTRLSRSDVTNLFKASNIYLSPYRSEGFGLTILEAMASELVPVVTNYGPSKEYCSLECCYFVDAIETECRLRPCGNMSIFKYKTRYQPRWSEPSLSSLKKLMKMVYLNQDELKKRRKICKLDAMKYTWKNAADKIQKRIFEIIK